MTGHKVNSWFLHELRRALLHLYDPADLGKSPLLDLFGLRERADASSALQALLLEGIERHRPTPSVPAQANAWRIYHLLSQRYSEQLTQREVATDLGLSIRQLRRQEFAAVRVLADYLWAHHDLAPKATTLVQGLAPAADSPPAAEGTPSREEELAWLKRSLPSEPVDAAEVIQAVLSTVGPLARAFEVTLDCAVPPHLRLAGQVPSVRQALLNVLTAAIHCVPGGRVEVTAAAMAKQVRVTIRPVARNRAPSPLHDEDRESLEMARQLLALCEGSLEVRPPGGPLEPFLARALLPAGEQAMVLVIDDNADTLRLLERYLEGSRYRFAGTRDPQQAVSLAEEVAPRIIILDVMLPGVDGWELLGRLREHPKTGGVPIVVCTILPQERLALTLGAVAFMRKPVSQLDLLAVLDRQLGLPSPGSR